MRKKSFVAIIFLFLVFFITQSCSSPESSDQLFLSSESDSSSSSRSDVDVASGTIQIFLKDKPVDEALEINVEIDEIRVHMAEPDMFITVSDVLQPFDLLELKNNPVPIATYDLDAGHYNQIRMSVVSGNIVFEGEDPYDLKIPSSEIKIHVHFEIVENGTVSITLDFDGEKSIKATKRGNKDEYILRPVIKVEGVEIT
jgi:hypothetical protein